MKKASENKKRFFLRRWLIGNANPEESRQLKQWAKDDPFLSDAMEGYQAFPDADHSQNLERMRSRLKKNYSGKKRSVIFVSFSKYAAAAAVVLLLGLMTWMWLQPAQMELALDNAQALPETEVPAPMEEKLAMEEVESDESAPVASVPAPITADKRKEPKKDIVSAPKTTPPIAKPENKTSEITDELSSEPIAASMLEEEADLPEPPPAPPVAPSRAPIILEQPSDDQAILAERAKELALSRAIVGQVFTNDGEPLIGASIVATGTKNGTISDVEGRFQINVGNEIKDLDVNYTGFNALRVPLSKSDSISIVMEDAGMVLDEVVVTGQSKRKKAKRSKAQASPKAEVGPDKSKAFPEGGYRKFNKYLQKNLIAPEAAVSNNINGTVILQFSVSSDGQPTDIRVLQSLGYGCDEEAVRLLKEGPKWKNKTGYPVVVTSVPIECRSE